MTPAPAPTGTVGASETLGGLGQVGGAAGLVVVLAVAVFLTVFLLGCTWAGFTMWQEKRKGLHLHADGTLHQHLDGHKAHVHPVTATASGWRRVKAVLWQGEIENAPGINVHDREGERGDDFFWFGTR